MNRNLVLIAVFIIAVVATSCTTTSVSVTIVPKDYNFGTITFGESASTDIILTNKYNVDISLISTNLQGLNPQQFVVIAGGSPGTLIPGKNSTHTISVLFTPTGGAAQALLVINYTDNKGRPKFLEVELKGDCLAVPLFEISVTNTPPSHDFGTLNLGQFLDFTITIDNTGIADLNITDIQIGGTDFIVFSGWTGVTVVVAPGTNVDIVVRFEPTVTGTLQDTISITHDATNDVSPFDIALSGIGTDPQFATNIAGTPPEIDFGLLFTSAPAVSQKFEISNIGTGDLVISSMQITGNEYSIASGWSGTPITIIASAKVEITLKFNPTSDGVKNGTISIAHSASNVASPYEANLLGEGKSNYTAETFTKGMTPISGGSTLYLSDDDYQSIPIGFTFNYYGNDYTNIYVCSNGFAGFGPGLTDYDWWEEFYPLPSSYTPNNTIYLFSCDLDPSYSGSIKYKLEGSMPDRVLTIEYSNVPDYDLTGYVTGQIKIYETANYIELHYSTSGMSWPSMGWTDIIIGLDDMNGTKGVDYDGVNHNPATYTEPTTNIRYK